MLNKDSEIDVEGLFIDILCMLERLGANGTTHNDIKPENIVKYENRWFLIDFETCTRFTRYDENRKCFLNRYGLLTCSSYSKGYRSPERIAPFEFNEEIFTGRVSPQSDIYSFGLVMLEVLGNERIRGMETGDTVELKLKELDIKNEIIKKYLPLMLEIDSEKRPTSKEILTSIYSIDNKQEERIIEGETFFSQNHYYSLLFGKRKH